MGEEKKKIDKSVVLYVLESGSKYHCDGCAFISHDGKCTQYVKKDEDVKPFGGCNLWQPLSKGAAVGNRSNTREVTGYLENEPGFSCGRCEEFIPDASRCEKVAGYIDPRACCNRWEKSPVYGDLSETKLRSMKEFR